MRGQLVPNQMLGDMTTLRVGGPAQLLFRPADEDDLSLFLRHLPDDIRLTVIGLGSNLLIRDGGLDGVVIRLPARGFGTIEILDNHRVRVGAAVPDVKVATAAAEAGIDGLWFYRGIPGGIGGALYMNAGCYKTETTDRMVELRAVLRTGEIVTLSHGDMGYRYRKSNGPARRRLRLGNVSGVSGRSDDHPQRDADRDRAAREFSADPRQDRGSTFKNPEGHSSWKLIDEAGGRGFTFGRAQMSELHSNFLINTGEADAFEVETVGETIRRKVRDTHGIELRWEVRRMGHFVPGREVREFMDGEPFVGMV